MEKNIKGQGDKVTHTDDREVPDITIQPPSDDDSAHNGGAQVGDDVVFALGDGDGVVFALGDGDGVDEGDGPIKALKKLWNRRICSSGQDDEGQGTTDPESLHIPGVPEEVPLSEYFERYKRSPGNRDRPYGAGAVIIVPLFTTDLRGYKADIQRIEELFVQKLLYKPFKVTRNCTREVLLRELENIRNDIQNSSIEFDRLVCFVLSHGEKDGIHTCGDDEGVLEEMHVVKRAVLTENGEAEVIEENKKVVTTVEEIVELFKHSPECLPKLADKPKLFVIQACRGTNIVRAAGSTAEVRSADEVDGNPRDLAQRFPATIPIDADIEICYASTPETYAFVNDDCGSWLVQSLLTAFEHHMKKRHVSEMLMAARSAVAEKRQRANVGYAVQIPSVFTTFRKEFWLYHGRRRNASGAIVPTQSAAQTAESRMHSVTIPIDCFTCHVNGLTECLCNNS